MVLERVVLDDCEPTGLRIKAWAKLVKVWASLTGLTSKPFGQETQASGGRFTTLRQTKTSGPNRRIKKMPLCVSEAAFFENPSWPDLAVFEKKMAEYADAVVVSAAILQRAGMPAIVQGFWTEHSERSVLPTNLSVLGRWKLERSDTYVAGGGQAPARELPPRSGRARGGELLAGRDRHALPEETATEIAEKLAEKWRTGSIQVEQAQR